MIFDDRTAVRRTPGSSGFTYIELLVASALMLGSLVTLASMFIVGLSQVNTAGNTTMALAAARQVLEDARRLPYDNVVNLNGFDTEDIETLPAADPERAVARRWRSAIAGAGVGWTFTEEERQKWPGLSDQGEALSAVGRIQAVQLNANITEISVLIQIPGAWKPIEIATRIVRL